MFQRNLFLATLLFSSFFATPIILADEIQDGSLKIKKETRVVTNFNKIIVSGFGHLQIRQGKKEALTIEAPDDILPFIISEVKNRELFLGPDTSKVFSKANTPVNYYLTVNEVKGIQASGSMDVLIPNLKTDELNLSLSGSGKTKIKMKVRKFILKMDGAEEVSAQGSADEQNIAISGAGNFNAKKFFTNTSSVKIEGSGSAEVNAKNTLEVEIAGSGIVKYYGSPKVTQTISGSGEIIPLN